MRNVFRVFWRDVKRIAKVPQAWLVVLFLIVLPSLYAWFNVLGFGIPMRTRETFAYASSTRTQVRMTRLSGTFTSVTTWSMS